MVGSIPVAILTRCQYVNINALQLYKHEYGWVVKVRNISEAVLGPLAIILTVAIQPVVSMMDKEFIVALILPPLCF